MFANHPDHTTSPELLNAAQAVVDWITASGKGTFPRLIGARSDHKGGRQEFELELSSGLIMRLSREVSGASPDALQSMAARALAATAEAPRIVPQWRAMTRELHRLVSAAQVMGVPARIHRVELAEYGDWEDGASPLFLGGIHSLGNNLEPTIHWVRLRSITKIQDAFYDEVQRLEIRNSVRIARGSEGASGTIDALALQAAARCPDPNACIRRLATSDVVELQDGTTLEWCDGHVRSHDNGHEGQLEWSGNQLVINDCQLAETLIDNVAGRPITDLVQHARLSPAMTIRSARNGGQPNAPTLHIDLDLKIFKICTVTGTWW
jgi:hypothetical protein